LASRNGNSGTAHPKHHSKELVCHREIVSLNAVVCHEQPASQALFRVVAPIAGRCARYLSMVDQGIAEQKDPQDWKVLQFLP
jgi:hypothetical protein